MNKLASGKGVSILLNIQVVPGDTVCIHILWLLFRMVKSDIKIDIYRILDRKVKHLLQCKLLKCNHLTKIFK